MKITSVSALSDSDLQNLRKLSGLCQNHDQTALSFPLEEEEPCQQYYLMYEDGILVSALARTFREDIGYESIGLTHPGYRRQGRFYALLSRAAEDLPEEEPLVLMADGKGESGLKAAAALSCDYWFSEYLMEITPDQIKAKADVQEAASALTLEKAICDPAAPDIATYRLQSEAGTIGSCRLATHSHAHYLYGFEIQSGYRNQGYGRCFLYLLCCQLLLSDDTICNEKKSMPLLLQVNSQNEGACHLYQSFGFRITDELRYYLW